ncbi:hypothetical protein H6G76_32845 [Nostoc sp. FACHB-152]|uniref:hypothetical protein n=1 Tax=unclassified Nostoc TaxID=2593658 RepID=UPI001681D096|nr:MULTISPECIES: hypothetical protein [unclassified Nostoc]MBD2451826.1 hypothetical protein [Nostoc sp. FACHB-152]MBD2473081.1 hypothetical protein [Nostoc sp. FACHB-145]
MLLNTNDWDRVRELSRAQRLVMVNAGLAIWRLVSELGQIVRFSSGVRKGCREIQGSSVTVRLLQCYETISLLLSSKKLTMIETGVNK